MFSFSVFLLVLILARVDRIFVFAQAPVCWNLAIGLGHGEVCSFDSTDTADLELYLVQDKDHDPDLPACADSGGLFIMVITYYDIVHVKQTATALPVIIDDVYSGTLRFDFPNVPLTNMWNGDLVSMSVTASESGSMATFRASSYLHSKVQSIFYTDTTTTISSTIPVIVDTTTVVTTIQDSTTIDGPTVTITSPVTHGTHTNTARPTTTTKTLTITQNPVTHTSISVVHTTTILYCIGGGHNKKRTPLSPHNPRAKDLSRRQTAPAVFEIPNCGAITLTSIVTSTAIAIVAVESDVTATSTSISVVTNTFTSPTSTSILYPVTSGLTTVTPTATRTVNAVLPRSTVQSVRTVTVTQTVIGGSGRGRRCDGDGGYRVPVGGRAGGFGVPGRVH